MICYPNRFLFRGLALTCAMAIAPGQSPLFGQSAAQIQSTGVQQEKFMSSGQLDSLVAPIALYPDSLVAQVLAASTYPLQIVTAERWVQQNSALKGKELVEAAGRQDWDPSIQALVAFPTVLQMLDQSLEWTTALGNAFLAQQTEVMAAIQRMRMKAQQSGKLQSDTHQQVQTTTVEGQPAIVIQPADPEVIYVPSYEPAAVYGAAPEYYPYPAVAYPTGGVLAASAISFGVGVAVGAIFNGCCGGGWGWGWGANWGPHASLYVNNNFFNHNSNAFVNRGNWGNAYRGGGRAGWNHNPRYRSAVPYANRSVANRYNGGRPGSMRPAQRPANVANIRPPGSQGGANRLPGNAGARPGGRGGASQLPANVGANRPRGPSAAQRPANPGANRSAGGRSGWNGSRGQSNRGGAFQGGSAARARSSGNRGSRSMGGGRSRGGGGGGRRGGGRRR